SDHWDSADRHDHALPGFRGSTSKAPGLGERLDSMESSGFKPSGPFRDSLSEENRPSMRSVTSLRQIVKRERHLFAVEIDLEHSVDRFADNGELVERRLEQALLHRAVDGRDQDDKAGVVLRQLRLWLTFGDTRLRGGDASGHRATRRSPVHTLRA